jgi:hypothetical protein
MMPKLDTHIQDFSLLRIFGGVLNATGAVSGSVPILSKESEDDIF